MERTQPAPTRATLGWIGQAVSGVLLLGLLGLHMIAHHYIVEGGLRNYAQVLDYVRNPLILTIEIVFLIVVVYHALLGVRAILLDLGLNATQQTWLNRGLIVVGIVTLVYGVGLAVALFGMANA